MSVSATQNIIRLAPKPNGLPTKLQAWTASPSVDGDASAGTVTLSAVTRPNGNSTDDPLYIAVLSVVASYYTSPMMAIGYAEGGNYEFSANAAAASRTHDYFGDYEETTNTVGGASMSILLRSSSPVYLGRVVASTGQVHVALETNTNTVNYMAVFKGLMSTEPFVIPDWIKM